MVHTVTLLPDHNGITRPKVSGNEYVVDGYIRVEEATSGGEVIEASSFGLSTVHCVAITGNGLSATYQAYVEVGNHPVNSSGEYESSTQFALVFVANDGTNAAATGDISDLNVRVRVWGNL